LTVYKVNPSAESCVDFPLHPRQLGNVASTCSLTRPSHEAPREGCSSRASWLAGNHERQVLTQDPAEWGPSNTYAHLQLSARELGWMASLASTGRIGDDVLLCHGTPRSDSEYCLETAEPAGVRMATAQEVEDRLSDARTAVVACGHTHVPRSMRSARGQLLVNPGSVGVPGYDDTVPIPHVIETGSPDARYAIIERHGTAWSAALISVPYDRRSMARLARQRHRPDWERALLTGYMG
jgi:predicted phosphodiesterase